MPKLAFYAASVSAGVGATGVLIAWDRHDVGPRDDIDVLPGCTLYSYANMTSGTQIAKVKTRSPIAIPETDCPDELFLPDHDFVSRFQLKPGGTSFGSVADFTFDVFEDSARIYGVAGEGRTLKVDLADGSFGVQEISFQERLEVQAMEDPLSGWAALINRTVPAKELWQELMTPNRPMFV